MKKLLIVSLFLLGMIGLMAQTPHLAIFHLQTEAGGYHAADALGFRACVVTPFGGGEQWTGDGNFMYWNYPGGTGGENSAPTLYIDGSDPDTPGAIAIQMAPMESWGQMWGGPANVVTANFYFIDGEGNETGPYNLAKAASGASTTYPDVIAWGGPTGPVVPDAWATYMNPDDGATNVGINMDNVEVTMPGLNWSYTGTVDPDGFEVWINGEHIDDVDFEVGSVVYGFIHPIDLAYATLYTWGIKPYIVENGSKGLKGMKSRPVETRLYPTGEMDTWSFTTMAEPVPEVHPSLATLVGPAIDVAVPVESQLEWAYEGEAVTGFEVIFNGADPVDVASDVMTYNPGELMYNTNYTWSVTPYILPAAKGLRGMKSRIEDPQRLYPEGTVETWGFLTDDSYVEDTPVDVPGENPNNVQVTVTVSLTGNAPGSWTPNAPQGIAAPGTGLVGGHGQFNFGATIAQSVAGTFTYTFTTSITQGIVFVDGQVYFTGAFPGGIVTVEIAFTGAKDAHEVVITEPTLPVELSSFTAVAHANEYVTLNWVTESESNLQGYNVYRSETENQDQAIRINPITVEANNATQTTNYSYTDREVETATYYYWLEVAELSNENTFHGPIVVTVEDDAVVDAITATTFRNFGPSPFTESTSTTLRVKEGETASVTIYNLLGQVVSRESFSAGSHDFTFNGRDLNNKSVANGIYFVKMTSPTQSKSFKIVKIK